MQRSWWTRAFATMLAAWFAIAVVEPAALHTCPMHGGPAGAHAAHGAAEHAQSAADHGAPERSSSRQCTCLGDCVGVSGGALPAALPRMHVPAAVATAGEIHAFGPELLPSPPGLLLPFANGPPRVALA
jgi:hypothetical protein